MINFKMTIDSRLKACMVMSLGLCCHFFGYECARAASIALLAAKETGMGNEALPLTILLGSPASGFVLYLYSKSIKRNGSQTTLRLSNFICSLLLGLITFYSLFYKEYLKGYCGNFIIIFFYAFREIYVSLLSTQQWAFIASNLDKSTSNFLVSFTGIVSVASAVGSCAIEQLVNYGGVNCLLVTSFLSVLMTFACSEISYLIIYHSNENKMKDIINTSNKSNNSNTTDDKTIAPISILKNFKSNYNNIKNNNRTDLSDETKNNTSMTKKKTGFWYDSWALVQKHKILQLLFIEAVTHQLCSNMLNLMFHNGLGLEVEQNSVRATLVGRFFATVNITACGLQCFVLPGILSQSSLPSVLTKIPFLVFLAIALGIFRPGLISVMLGFGTIKVLEYSIMTAASEMIYMPMGHDVRYLGKELIKFFGHKLGKSFSSLVLSAMVSHLKPSLTTQSIWGAVFTLCWGVSMYSLSEFLIERERNDEIEKMKKPLLQFNGLNNINTLSASSVQKKLEHDNIGDEDLTTITESEITNNNINNAIVNNNEPNSLLKENIHYDNNKTAFSPPNKTKTKELFVQSNYRINSDDYQLGLATPTNSSPLSFKEQQLNEMDSHRHNIKPFNKILQENDSLIQQQMNSLNFENSSVFNDDENLFNKKKSNDEYNGMGPILLRVGSAHVSLNSLQEM